LPAPHAAWELPWKGERLMFIHTNPKRERGSV
jgi:hypothetical protein